MENRYSLLRIEIRYEHDVVLCRQRSRILAELLGFDSMDQTRISTAVSEIARNAFVYARGGEVLYSVEGKEKPQEYRIEIRDSGPGIPNVKDILEGRFYSSTGMGVGLRGAQKLMDTFQITTELGKGTTVTLGKYLPPSAPQVTPELIHRIVLELSHKRPQDPFEEIQQQNQELVRAMAELKIRQEQLEQLNRELVDTNRGVVALYTELEEKAASLKSANEVKTRFLSNMSHEFRTPLNSILALTQILLDRLDGDLTQEQEKQIFYIRKAAETLSELINDLLDLAKIEAGKTTVQVEEFQVSDLFSALRGMLKPIHLNPTVSLVIEDPPVQITLQSDEGKVSQILRNLISNAIKFTERGEIRVVAEVGERDQVVFSVSDTGIGIPEEYQKKIFEEYFQVDTPLHKKQRGTGLGLAISKKLAELLGGTITVKSAPGIGSTFRLIVPRVYIRPVADRTQTVTLGVLSLETGKPFELDPLKVPILLLEDDETTVVLYEKYLMGSGFQLIHARSIQDAWQCIEAYKPAAVILDILLPKEEGWDFLVDLKSREISRDIPVIIASVLQVYEKGIVLGAEDCAVKPIERKWLLEKLRSFEVKFPIRSILVIDDEEIARYVLKTSLSNTKYRVLEASDGMAGIKVAETERPELIFLDLVLPGMDGFETLERLKSSPATKDIPVIILTSKLLTMEEKIRLSERASDVLSKSAPPADRILKIVQDTLARIVQQGGSA
ncbi:MAG: ATP-binding protein [Spirochaetes bacterium]|nr:ATP-binding protein [Spirochaetota bacterium]